MKDTKLYRPFTQLGISKDEAKDLMECIKAGQAAGKDTLVGDYMCKKLATVRRITHLDAKISHRICSDQYYINRSKKQWRTQLVRLTKPVMPYDDVPDATTAERAITTQHFLISGAAQFDSNGNVYVYPASESGEILSLNEVTGGAGYSREQALTELLSLASKWVNMMQASEAPY
jgi:hypothetical protein